MKVKLISFTPDGEKLLAYIARVSNPNNQDNPNYEKLIGYCITHNHWSVFEHAFMTVEIETTRAISPQILRHRSFTFQEFSQRYANSGDLWEIEPIEFRSQDNKNRQNSIENISTDEQEKYNLLVSSHFEESYKIYNSLLESWVAKECARGVLPLATPTRLYMSWNVRSWIHYINLRTTEGTQKEHRLIAESVKEIFKQVYPTTSLALNY